jgi:hypothetical protein
MPPGAVAALSAAAAPQQKRLVRQSFESLEEYYSDAVIPLFDGRLFEIAP